MVRAYILASEEAFQAIYDHEVLSAMCARQCVCVCVASAHAMSASCPRLIHSSNAMSCNIIPIVAAHFVNITDQQETVFSYPMQIVSHK